MAGKRILKLGVIVVTLFFAIFLVGKEEIFLVRNALKAETTSGGVYDNLQIGDTINFYDREYTVFKITDNTDEYVELSAVNFSEEIDYLPSTHIDGATINGTTYRKYKDMIVKDTNKAKADTSPFATAFLKYNNINGSLSYVMRLLPQPMDADLICSALGKGNFWYDGMPNQGSAYYKDSNCVTGRLPMRTSRAHVPFVLMNVKFPKNFNYDLESVTLTSNNSNLIENEFKNSEEYQVATYVNSPDGSGVDFTFSLKTNSDKFTIRDGAVYLSDYTIKSGTYDIQIQAVNNKDASKIIESNSIKITIQDPYKKVTDLTYTPDTGKDPLKLDSNTSAGQIGTISASYDTGSESGRGIRFALTNTNANDNTNFTLTTDGKLSIASDLTVAKTYNVEVTAYETGIVDGASVDVEGKSYTKTFQLVVKDKDPEITDITFTPNYPNGKAGWNYGDTGINASGEQTGSFSFTGGTSGSIDEATKKDYQKWELVDADGNTTTDTNFTIVDNKLQAKGKVPIGSYTLYVMVTDLNGQTFTKEITIDIAKASNPFDWVDAVKNTDYLYYGDTLALDLTGVEENATITFAPSLYVKNGIFTAYDVTKTQEITATTTETSSYGITAIKHTLEVKKRPLSVMTQLQDVSGNWQESVTIKQGQSLPSKQVVEDTSDPNSKGLVSTENRVDHPIVGTVTYEYRQGNTKVKNPSEKAGTYQLYAIYSTSKYYDVSVTKVATLVVEEPDTIDDANKQQFYEFKLTDGSTPDITKWQKEDIIIHPKHATYTQMKVDNGNYQAGDQTYTSEGSNTVALSFKDASGATTSTITETLKIDKTNPIIDKIEFSENDVVQSAGNGSFQYLFKNIADIAITASDAQSGIANYTVKVTKLKADGSIDTTQPPVVNDIPSTATTLTTSITQQGMYQVEISVSDASGRSSTISTATMKIKSTQTTMEVKGYLNSDSAKPYDGKTWTNQPILFKLHASDQTALTNLQMSTDGTNFTAMSDTEYLLPNTASIDGITYYFKAVNIDGDEVSTSIKIYMDVDAPATPTITWQDKKQNPLQEFISLLSFDSLFSKEVQAFFTASDAPSGIDTYSYTITELDREGTDIGTPMTGKGSTYDLKKNKNYRVEVIAYDKAGNPSSPAIKTVQIDTEAPLIEGVKDKSEYKQYYLPRFISVKDMPVNGSGLKTATYTRDEEVAVTISHTVKLMDTGSYVVEVEDYAGNKVTLTFKIVPLPSLNDIDGTDESKAIIDQIQKELDEIKEKIDDTEEKNYTEWIEDATEKWESLRKKVVEDEETTSKVEGEGDTTFDPKVELIVDPISEEKLPKLPRKALFAYDVYLMKNNTVVQPDGSVKVYLPYNEEEAPIVYQIDEDGAVKEIKATKENGYVTFTTDTLLQYAISNTAQELTDPVDDKTCVVGPDGIAGTKDDICGEGNGDKEPEKKPDGSVEVPDGGTIVFPNGNEIDTPNGGIIKPDGSVELPDGTQYDPEGNIIPEDITKPKECKLNGKAINIDSDKDGLPDLNLDIRNANGEQEPDCIADLNLDVDNDGIADIDIDTDGDGQADINIDVDKDGQADINIAKVSLWKPDKNDCVYMGFRYDTMADIKPYLNVDEDGDGEPDRNIDDDGDGIPDRNIDADWFEKYGNPTTVKANYKESEGTGGVLTGDNTKWLLWWIMLVITGATMAGHLWKKHHKIRQH